MILNHDIFYTLTGGPEKVYETFPKTFLQKVGHEISSNITISGNPKPKIVWYIGSDVIQDVWEEDTKIIKHEYIYSFRLKIASNMCGRSLSYRATGYNNHYIEEKSTVILENCKKC